MAITLNVEDGTGLADANSYVASADADAYFADRANTVWAAASDDAKASALIQATQYLDARYRFKGERKSSTQALEWPRTRWAGLCAISGVPTDPAYDWPVQRVKDATCEAALRALAAPLFQDETPQIVQSTRVDVIQVTYAQGIRNGGQIRITVVDALLRRYITAGGNTIELVRG